MQYRVGMILVAFALLGGCESEDEKFAKKIDENTDLNLEQARDYVAQYKDGRGTFSVVGGNGSNMFGGDNSTEEFTVVVCNFGYTIGTVDVNLPPSRGREIGPRTCDEMRPEAGSAPDRVKHIGASSPPSNWHGAWLRRKSP